MTLVLIVDDDTLVRDSLCRGLTMLGYDAMGVASGFEALWSIQEHEPDAVICDLFMPEMDGLEFLSHLAGLEPRPLTIMISGGSTQLGLPPNKYLEMALRLGADAVLAKPFSLSELAALLETGGRKDGGSTAQQQKGVR